MDGGEEKHESSQPLVVHLKLLVTHAGEQRDEVDLGAQHVDEGHEASAIMPERSASGGLPKLRSTR